MKQLYARITIRPDPHENYLAHRRRRFGRRMELAGIRPASIQKYLSRAFPGPFRRALRQEMQRLIWDMKFRRRAA